MTGFAKTIPIRTRTEIHFNADSQVYFHRWLFANPVKPCWCIMGPMKPLGSTNQNWRGVKLLPMPILTYPADCVHICHLVKMQYHCLCPNGRENPPLACPPTPTTPAPLPPTHLLIQDTHDITGVVKILSQKSVVNTAQQSLL